MTRTVRDANGRIIHSRHVRVALPPDDRDPPDRDRVGRGAVADAAAARAPARFLSYEPQAVVRRPISANRLSTRSDGAETGSGPSVVQVTATSVPVWRPPEIHLAISLAGRGRA